MAYRLRTETIALGQLPVGNYQYMLRCWRVRIRWVPAANNRVDGALVTAMATAPAELVLEYGGAYGPGDVPVDLNQRLALTVATSAVGSMVFEYLEPQ